MHLKLAGKLLLGLSRALESPRSADHSPHCTGRRRASPIALARSRAQLTGAGPPGPHSRDPSSHMLRRASTCTPNVCGENVGGWVEQAGAGRRQRAGARSTRRSALPRGVAQWNCVLGGSTDPSRFLPLNLSFLFCLRRCAGCRQRLLPQPEAALGPLGIHPRSSCTAMRP